MNLADALSISAGKDGLRAAIVYRDRTITYDQLDADAGRFAAALTDIGVEPGDRVALWLPNHPAFVSSLYGAWRAGAIAVPVNSMLTWRETRQILEDSGSRVVVCASPHVGAGAPPFRELDVLEHVVVVDAEPGEAELGFDALVSANPGRVMAVELDTEHLALLGYTSGTTGVPKGAMLTHGNLRSNVDQMLRMPIAPGAGDVALGVLPLTHIFGLNVLLNLTICVGATIVLHERFEPVPALEAIREHRVTRVASAPPAYVAWLQLGNASREDFASVEVATSGAAPLSAQTHREFRDRFGITIWEGYGLTETSPTLTSTAIGGTAKPGSVGRALHGVELRLVDTDGEDAEQGDEGEVVVRGPNVFRGYWQHPAETSRVLRNGWFRTGDVAIADEDGDLYLVDRRKDLILVSGFNVYPKEVEDVLVAHPKVRDSAAVGAPDALHGEQVRALVVAAPGTAPTEDELVSWCRTRLAPFKVPGVIELVAEIPRNAAGKVLRRELR